MKQTPDNQRTTKVIGDHVYMRVLRIGLKDLHTR